MGRETSRYCRTCGVTAPPQGRFCSSCGASLNLVTPYPAPRALGEVPASPTIQPAIVTPTVGGSVRMGFGIALGMLLFVAVLGIGVLIAVALATSTITWPFAEQGQRFEGVGPSESVPVTLDGVYNVSWAAEPTSPSACRIDAVLVPATGTQQPTAILSSPIEAGKVTSGSRSITLPSGEYVVRVESGCRWSIRLVQS